jgi:hypothetical protein
MDTLYLVQGDNGSQVKVILTRDDTGAPVDLTGATVTLKFKKKNTGLVLSSINSINFDPDELEAGVAIFLFDTTALDIASGNYVGEIQITLSNGNIETVFEQLEFLIREDY